MARSERGAKLYETIYGILLQWCNVNEDYNGARTFPHEQNLKTKCFIHRFSKLLLEVLKQRQTHFCKKSLVYQNKFLPTSLAFLKNSFLIIMSDDNSTKLIYYSQEFMAVRNTSGFSYPATESCCVFLSVELLIVWRIHGLKKKHKVRKQ